MQRDIKHFTVSSLFASVLFNTRLLVHLSNIHRRPSALPAPSLPYYLSYLFHLILCQRCVYGYEKFYVSLIPCYSFLAPFFPLVFFSLEIDVEEKGDDVWRAPECLFRNDQQRVVISLRFAARGFSIARVIVSLLYC